MPGEPTNADESRAKAAVAELPLVDRIRLLSGRDFWTTQPMDTRIPSVLMTDGPHGLRKQTGDSDHVGLADSKPATCFPTAAALASTWDPALVQEVGAAIGAEARAQGVALVLGPGLNLKRHPRGGRNFEYFAEDPYLSGTMAAAMVRGIQSQGVGACLKHYAANNQETRRMVVDAIIDERTLRELYLRGFEIAVESGPAAVMTAYNLVNGQYISDHEHLLGDILRGEWGYDGLVVSDWGGANDRVAGLRVGMDLEMPGGAGAFDAEIASAVRAGRLAEADVNRSAARVAALAMSRHRTDRPAADLEAHHSLARRTAAAGCVLLANDGILPLADPAGVALIGAFAEHPRFQGGGSSRVNPTQVSSLRDALPEARYAPGYDPVTGATTPALIAEAAAAARSARTVVLILGMPERLETEGLDRDDWRLAESMDQLAEVVLDVNPRTAIVLVNGAPVAMPWGHRAAALLEAYLGGQAGGAALADVLTGAADPGGRLAESFPFATTDLPADRNFPGSGRQVQYRETFHVGYRFHDTAGVPARFAFGHGLSYATFGYGPVDVTGEGTDWTVELRVTNTGARPGSDVVQVYVRAVESAVARPAKELQGFAKVHLAPGESAPVRITLSRRSFTIWDVASEQWRVEPGEYEILVGASSTDIRGSAMIDVATPETVTPVPGTAEPVASDEEFAALLRGPIPAPPPIRPFTRTSTIGDLRSHPVGRALAVAMVAAIRRRVRLEDDQHASDTLTTVIDGMPLRAFAQLTNGVPMNVIDRVLALLNGDLRRVIRPQP